MLTTMPTLYARGNGVDEHMTLGPGDPWAVHTFPPDRQRTYALSLLRERFPAVRQWHLPGDAP